MTLFLLCVFAFKGLGNLNLRTSFASAKNVFLHVHSPRAHTEAPPFATDVHRETFCAQAAELQLGTMKSLHKIRAVIHISRLAMRVHGDFVEAGVAEGGGSFCILSFLACVGALETRELHLFDTFEGIPAPVRAEDESFEPGRFHKSERAFWENAQRWKLYYENNITYQFSKHNFTESIMPWEQALQHMTVHRGLFAETMPNALQDRAVAALFCDGDMYQSSLDCMVGASESLVDRAMIYHDDYGTFYGNFRAVHDWKETNSDRGEIYLVPQDGPFAYYTLSSRCLGPADNSGRKQLACERHQIIEAAFWQHWQ